MASLLPQQSPGVDFMASAELFRCYKLFQVEESSPVAGGEMPLHGVDKGPLTPGSNGIAIELCCWCETRNYSVLVMVCNNGYIILRLEPFLRPPFIKQLKWFESKEQHVLDVTMDPSGEWLALACLDGCVYLLPVLTLMMPDCSPSHKYGDLKDVTVIKPSGKVAPPTSVVWWESVDRHQIIITGSELGEITFFDVQEKTDVASLTLRGCIDSLMLAKKADSTTHLLFSLRGGEWWWMLLEEQYHEAAGTSYSDVQASGFEVVYDDAVLRSFLSRSGIHAAAGEFEPKYFQNFSEVIKLSVQDWKDLHLVGALNLGNQQFELYDYDFEFQGGPVRAFKLSPRVTHVLASERMLFTLSHNDNTDDKCSFTLCILSSELAQRSTCEFSSKAVIQTFTMNLEDSIVGFYGTRLESHEIASESRDLTTPTNLGGCIIVTRSTVYQCKQILSPEALFLRTAKSSTNHHLTDNVAIAYRLDICALYRAAAKLSIQKGEFGEALKMFEQAKSPVSQVVENFVRLERIPELIKFLQEVVYDESSLAPSTNPRMLQDVLVHCFIHQCLVCTDPVEEASLKANFSLFINDKFLYNQPVTMEMLVRTGLKEQLFELAKTHQRLHGSLEVLLQYGSSELEPSLQTALVNKQFAEALSTVANGLFLHQMTPTNFAKCIIAKPSIIPDHLPYLRSLLSKLDISTLLHLARVFDPSHSTIKPLLSAALSMKRSSSTGSLVSLASTETTSVASTGSRMDASAPSLASYIETFLHILVVLNHKRKQRPQETSGLLALSPMADKLGTTPEDRSLRPIATFANGSQLLQGGVVSCGHHHAGMVMAGELYMWGCTQNGKLGHGDIEQTPVAAPLKVETLVMLNVKVLAVSCGAEHTVALCQEGVFSWGSSTHGQLGLGDTLKRTRPVQIPSLADVTLVSIECGQYHSIALDEEQRVWTWGWGIHGQLGLGSCEDLHSPTHAAKFDELCVSFIAAGFNHSAIITREGKLYTFGNGMYGQLGHGDNGKQTSPKLVSALANKLVYLVGCGNSHTLAVCSDQSVYHWGKSLHKPPSLSSAQGLRVYARNRREGAVSPSLANCLMPVALADLKLDDTIIQVGCGNFHCLLLTAAGSVYSWGSNMHGQIGHTHTPELSTPRIIPKLENHRVMTISCGDEFCVAVDDVGISWVWGRDDHGQLGMEFTTGAREGRKVCIFAPNPNPEIPRIACSRRTEKSPDGQESSLLEVDLEWDLPDLASIGSPYGCYCRKALNQALVSLHGFYRTGAVLFLCQDWQDWESMAIICNAEKQWPQVLGWKLRNLKSGQNMQEDQLLSVLEECLDGHVASCNSYHSRGFILSAVELLTQLIMFWKENDLKLTVTEPLLRKHMPALAYPLSLLLRSSQVTTGQNHFSFKFNLQVATETANHIRTGIPAPEELVRSVQGSQLGQGEPVPILKLPVETSPGDSRLWVEILRNLSKDLTKHPAIQLSEAMLGGMENNRSLPKQEGTKLLKPEGMIAYTCGHAFSDTQFQLRVLVDFMRRLEDLPIPIPHTASFLQQYYKQASHYSCACPVCVFQYLRKTQLEQCPEIPIKPWNP